MIIGLLALGSLTACTSAVRDSGMPPRPSSGATNMATTGNCSTADRNATLTGQVTLSFTGAGTGEAIVRIEGETQRSTVRVDVATGSYFELREGSYLFRVAVSGYRAVDERVQVVCGKTVPLNITLRAR